MATSKAMQAKLAARAAAAAGDEGSAGAATEDGTDTAGGLGIDDEGDSPALERALATEGSPTAEAPDQAEAKARAARAALFEEKLKGAREKRQAQKLAERAKADRQAAKAEREAAAAEKAKYDGLKTGSFKETLVALGRDPTKTYQELQREAIEASTPEAAARREKEAGERALEERFKPILSELEQLRAERAEVQAERAAIAEQTHASNVTSMFHRAGADPAFADLRIEYPDEALLDHVRYYDKHPDHFEAVALDYGVRLTTPGKGFTVHEVLQVLSAAQAAHNSGVQARRAAHRPAEHQSALPTVNGTAPRRNAGTAPGNDPALERSSSTEAPALSPRDRMRERAREEIRRRSERR